ncbi:PDZ domain-containing protein [Dokdonella sp.]|uniref:PDZ domain-containing protein n=1 Tax=Dokdonella sp. TaxID=2291710 RepID=UPI001B171FF4|nr:PDZ domain-containing protein [Dokdonella sp.]MBO9662503.1 PDZ domain-containing protein [Dokdonella sp.]
MILVAGCVSTPRGPGPGPSQEPPPVSSYVSERDAATIAEMRAAPPTAPELVLGKNPSSDPNRLAAQGFVRVGTANYAGSETVAREEADRQGQAVGADRILLYPPLPSATSAAAPVWNAAFYVRFKLPFGATFRDLKAEERAAIGHDGGVEIGSVVGGTPASRANLLAGDFVVQVNGKPIAGKSAFQNLLKANAGRTVTLTIVRNGETLQRVLRLGSLAPE